MGEGVGVDVVLVSVVIGPGGTPVAVAVAVVALRCVACCAGCRPVAVVVLRRLPPLFSRPRIPR